MWRLGILLSQLRSQLDQEKRLREIMRPDEAGLEQENHRLKVDIRLNIINY